MSAIRKIARCVAKHRMKKAGYEKFCKHSYSGPAWQTTRNGSVFSKKWREAVQWK